MSDPMTTDIDAVALEQALGGEYKMPDGRSFWIDSPVAREMVRRVQSAYVKDEAARVNEAQVWGFKNLNRAWDAEDRLKTLTEALSRNVVFTAYSERDPLAVRIEFASDADRVAAANAIDAALASAKPAQAGDDADVLQTYGKYQASVQAIVQRAQAADARALSLEHEFKNFHRMLCERFGYGHDEKDWKRDQVSLMEAIAARALSLETRLAAMGEALKEFRSFAASVWFDETAATDEERDAMDATRAILSTEASHHG